MADIVIDRVSKAYDGKPVLSNVSLRFPEGRVSCLMAPSGAGKTTLLKLMLGLESPDAGAITGMEGARLSAVFQEDRLIPRMDAVDNIRLARPALSPAEVHEAMARFGLNGCEGQPVAELSGGMRRRVALLRALMAEWNILLMDEPFNGLDAALRDQVIRETARMIGERTAVMVTHDPREADMLGAERFALPAPE